MTEQTYVEFTPYASVTFADAMVSNEIQDSTNWDALDTATKLRYLKYATRVIDNLQFVGYKTDEDQTNKFPRGGDTSFPLVVSRACVLVALEIANESFDLDANNLRSETIGDATWTYFESNTSIGLLNFPSKEGLSLLAPYILDPRVMRIANTG